MFVLNVPSGEWGRKGSEFPIGGRICHVYRWVLFLFPLVMPVKLACSRAGVPTLLQLYFDTVYVACLYNMVLNHAIGAFGYIFLQR